MCSVDVKNIDLVACFSKVVRLLVHKRARTGVASARIHVRYEQNFKGPSRRDVAS